MVAALDPNDSVGIIDSDFPDADFFTEFERFDLQHSVALNFGAQEPIMQVEAIYDHGKLKFITPLKLKHERFRVLVTGPDQALEQPPAPNLSLANVPADLLERAQVMREHLDAVRDAPLPHNDALPDLTPKQIDRIQGFCSNP